MTWPNDADGDVLRRMEQEDFDFSKPHPIDFNVDFDEWPPDSKAVALVKKQYPGTVVHEPKDEYGGYLQFQVHDRVSYELVMRIQRQVSALVAPYDGRCESWGVMQDEA